MGDNMLLLLSLISSTTAAPQWLVNPQFSPYGFLPYSLHNAPSGDLPALGRLLTTSSTGTLDTSTICGSGGATACTATGTARVDQFTTDAAKYSIYLVGDGIAVSKEYKIYVLATCTTAVSDAAKLATVTSPFFMINGFHVSGMYIAVYNDADTLIG